MPAAQRMGQRNSGFKRQRQCRHGRSVLWVRSLSIRRLALILDNPLACALPFNTTTCVGWISTAHPPNRAAKVDALRLSTLHD